MSNKQQDMENKLEEKIKHLANKPEVQQVDLILIFFSS